MKITQNKTILDCIKIFSFFNTRGTLAKGKKRNWEIA